MTDSPHAIAALTRLDVALGLLRDPLAAVVARDVPVGEVLGCVAAEMPSLQAAWPLQHRAAIDGWALRTRDIAGASSYSPVALVAAPTWVEAGATLPDGCDCVIDADNVERAGPLLQVVTEAIPGQGVRRAGQDFAAGASLIATGQRIGARGLLAARTLGITHLTVRRPRLHILNIAAVDGGAATASLIAQMTRAAGAEARSSEVRLRDAASVAGAIDQAIDADSCDLLVLIGGTGVGRTDATVAALANCGSVLAHGLALRPGRTAAVGNVRTTPVIALPGAPDHALAVWWSIVEPVLDHLAGRLRRETCSETCSLPLARKIASAVGLAEVVLLERQNAAWMPLAVGDLPLDYIVRAEAWLCIPEDSEGYAAGTTIAARVLRDVE